MILFTKAEAISAYIGIADKCGTSFIATNNFAVYHFIKELYRHLKY